MSALEICFRGFAVFWGLLVLWLNFAAWFRAERVMGRLGGVSGAARSMCLFRAMVVFMDIMVLLFVYAVLR